MQTFLYGAFGAVLYELVLFWSKRFSAPLLTFNLWQVCRDYGNLSASCWLRRDPLSLRPRANSLEGGTGRLRLADYPLRSGLRFGSGWKEKKGQDSIARSGIAVYGQTSSPCPWIDSRSHRPLLGRYYQWSGGAGNELDRCTTAVNAACRSNGAG